MRKCVGVFLVACVFAGVAVFGQQPKGEYYVLTGNIKEAAGTVTTDRGDQRTSFFGSVGFRVVPTAKGLLFYLFDFNLISKGVPTDKGDSGVLGLTLADAQDKTMAYDPRSGRASAEFAMVLHYELIDRVKGLRPIKTKGEADVFPSFTEEMKGKMAARFPAPVKVADRGSIGVDLDVTLELSKPVLGWVRKVNLVARVLVDWGRLLLDRAQYLRIQPVFIGTGPADPGRTGTAWATLMARAHELWNKCGGVRCIKFVVNTPIYLNKPGYKVLETTAEAAALQAEVSVADAVEVFVVDRMTFVCSWGGGACFSSGTASAKIVTCDQQLAVPAPCPCTWCPATCPPCPPCQTGAVNYYHLAHELGHALNLYHPPDPSCTARSIMEPSGFCCDNPNVQSAKNCRNASNPLLYWGRALCVGKPDIMD